MENLLQNIIDNNNNDNDNNKKEILIIGDIWDYRERMSKNFIKFFDYLKDNLHNFKIIYYGTGIPEFIKGLSLLNVINSYCKQNNPIVWICDVRGPTMVSEIYKYSGIKIFDYEDIMGKVEIIIREINENGYDYVLYKSDCLESDKIKNNCPCSKFIRYDHYIDNKLFDDYKLKKEYDVLCYGCIDYGCYPFRERLFKLLSNTEDINTYILNHPNYGYKLNHNMVNENLSKLINKSKLTVVTPSKFDIFLKKYVEVALSKSCMIGKIPKYNGEKFKNCIIKIDENMSDDQIINKIKYYIYHDNEREKIVDKAYDIAKKEYSYNSGMIIIENILDNIINNKNDKNNDDKNIKQIHVSYDLNSFKPKIKKKFNLIDYHNRYEPVIFFGLYNFIDYHLIRNHKGLCILIWGGTDSLMITEWNISKLLDYDCEGLRLNDKVNMLMDKFKENRSKNILVELANNLKDIKIKTCNNIPINIYNTLTKSNIKHISISLDITKDLNSMNINSKRINLSFVKKNEFYPIIKGRNVYIYTSKNNPDIYGKKLYEELIKKMSDTNFIVACFDDHKNIMDIYKKCFIGLRLTKHDGNANTVQELGLCGIKCVHNSDYPNAINWNGLDDIIESINKEKIYIGKQDKNMSKKMEKYISKDKENDWLNTKYYE